MMNYLKFWARSSKVSPTATKSTKLPGGRTDITENREIGPLSEVFVGEKVSHNRKLPDIGIWPGSWSAPARGKLISVDVAPRLSPGLSVPASVGPESGRHQPQTQISIGVSIGGRCKLAPPP